MDEFADLEDELRFDRTSVDTESIHSLVKSIEYDGLEPTMFITEQRSNWNVSKRIGFLALGILLLPVLGIGLLFIYPVFINGPFFQNTEVVDAKVYLAEQNLVIDYRMVDIEIKNLQCLSVTNRSHIKHSRHQSHSDHSSTTRHRYHLVTDEHELLLLLYDSQESLENRRRIIKLISKFAKVANLKILR